MTLPFSLGVLCRVCVVEDSPRLLLTCLPTCVLCRLADIPMVSDLILNHTAEAKEHGVNLQGFMIGNGCPGWDVLTCTPYSCGHTGGICSGGGTEVAVNFRYGHALASQPVYANWLAVCGDERWDDPSPACIDAINKFTDETATGGLAGSTYNIYDMCGRDGVDVPELLDEATGERADGAKGIYARLNDAQPPPLRPSDEHVKDKLSRIFTRQNAVEEQLGQRVGDHQNGYGGLNNYPCGEEAGMTMWLNVLSVQRALHVTTAHRKDGKWAPSTGLNFTHTAPTLLHVYPRLIEKLHVSSAPFPLPASFHFPLL